MDKPAIQVIDPALGAKILDADFKNILKKVKAGTPLSKTERDIVTQRTEGAKHTVDTMKQASTALGVSLKVLKRAKAAGCPGFVKGSRVELNATRKWLEENPETGDADAGHDEQLKAERVRKLRIENDKAEGLLISKAELAERLIGLCGQIDGTLKNKLCTEWPAAGAGMPADELAKFGIETHRSIVQQFKAFAKGEGVEIP